MAAFSYTKSFTTNASWSVPSGSNVATVPNTSNGSLGVACGATITHANLPANTTVLYYTDATTAILSNNATAVMTNVAVGVTNPDEIPYDAVPGVYGTLTTLKSGGDTYALNGLTLLIDNHTRYGRNCFKHASDAARSTALGSLNPSSYAGGNVRVDGRYSRLIPYDTGSGTLTHLKQVTVSQGSASGVLVGFYSSLTSAPVYGTDAATAIPASGWVLIRAWNGTEFSAGALTFTDGGGTAVTANATGASVVGWVEVNGDDAATYTGYRTNNFTVRGAWYDLGTTDGNRATTYQVPNNGHQQWVPAVWVQTETYTITDAVWADGVMTYTTSAAHDMKCGQEVTVTGVTPSAINCTDQFIEDITDTTFSVVMDDPGVSYTSGGSAYSYELWPCANTAVAAVRTTAGVETDNARRSKVFWNTNATTDLTLPTGVIRFGHDGTNSTGGYCPPSGRKLRIPNVFFNNNTTAARNQNSIPHATLATRYDFTMTYGGPVDIDKCLMNWYPSMVQAASALLTNVGVMTQLLVQEISSRVTIKNVGIGIEAATTNVSPFTLQYLYQGADIHGLIGCTGVSSGTSGVTLATIAYSPDLITKDMVVWQLGARTGVARWMTNTFCERLKSYRQHMIGMYTIFSYSADSLIKDFTFSDTTGVRAPTTQVFTGVIQLQGYMTNAVFEGLKVGAYAAEFTGAILYPTGSLRGPMSIRNIGTYDEPLALADPARFDKSWSRSGTTITVTDAGHTLELNDQIVVFLTNDTGQVTVGTKTVTAANYSGGAGTTFTFTGVAGANSTGLLSYYRTNAGLLVAGSGSGNAVDLKIQRCYITGSRSQLVSIDNSYSNIQIENVQKTHEYGNPDFIFVANNSFSKLGPGLSNDLDNSAQHGTAWLDGVYQAIPETESATWTRSGTTISLTFASPHNRAHSTSTLYPLEIASCSDEYALNLGYNLMQASVAGGSAPPDSLHYNVTGYATNLAGAAGTSGTCTVKNMTGTIILMMNEGTADNLTYYDIVGSTQFTGLGRVAMTQVGDSITFECPYWIRGHVGFAAVEPYVPAGTLANYWFQYQIDKGSGWSGWKTLCRRTPGSCTINAASPYNTVTVAASESWIQDGDFFHNTGYNARRNARVVSGGGTTSLVLDKTHNASGSSQVFSVFNLPTETGIDPDTGFRLKIKITTIIANTETLAGLRIFTHTTHESRQLTLPLDTFTLTLTGLVSGSDVVVLAHGTETVLDTVENIAGTTYTYTYETSQAVDIAVYKEGYFPHTTLYNYTLANSDASLPIVQVSDPSYLS